MRAMRRLLSLLLCLCALLTLAGTALAAGPDPFYLSVRVEGGSNTQVRAFEEAYPGNFYLSLSDLSQALNGTSKQFHFTYKSSDDSFCVTTNHPAGSPEESPITRARGGAVDLNLERNRLYVDGGERRYYTYRRNSSKDLYMSLTDVQLMLDLTATLLEGDTLQIDPYQPFKPDPKQLRRAGYFDAISAIVLADADTGELLFYRELNRALPVASLSKLMTYLLLCEAEEHGELSFSDNVTITQESERISRSSDGMIAMSAGAQIPMQELIDGMLLASSNEAAASLAAYAAGSTEAFVERMNTRAKELGLYSARFYSPHGLPVYTADAVTAKRQNTMSAYDMYKLCAYLLEHYPNLTGITSRQYSTMKTLKYSASNTNTLVFNLPGVTGLKTGSTNRAGYCVAVSMNVTRGNETHDLVLVLLGAETPELRGQAAEILLRWAKDYYAGHEFRTAA